MAKSKELKCVIIKPGLMPEMATIPNTLEGLQKTVEGYIEFVGINNDFCFVVNEEGKLVDEPKPNFRYYNDVIFGTVIIAKQKNCDLVSMTDEEQQIAYNACAKLRRATCNENPEDYCGVEIFTW